MPSFYQGSSSLNKSFFEPALGGLHFEVAQQFGEALLIDCLILPRSKIPNVAAPT